MQYRIVFVSLVLIVSSVLAAAQASTGDVDPYYFSSGGFDGPVRDMALQPDGKIIAVGEFNFAVGSGSRKIVRMNTDGTIDSSFKTGYGANNNVTHVVLQPDGKILLSGIFTSFN